MIGLSFLSVSFLQTFISSYSYVAIFLLMLLESMVFPVPSEVVLPFTGFLIAVGVIDPYLGFADAVIASLVGSMAGYFLGYFLGIDLFLRNIKKIGLREREYDKAIRWMNKYGNYFAFISRLIPAIRSISSIVCGAFKMDIKRFLGYSTLGISIWSFILIYLGFSLTKNWILIAHEIMGSTIYIIFFTVLIIVFYFLLRRHR